VRERSELIEGKSEIMEGKRQMEKGKGKMRGKYEEKLEEYGKTKKWPGKGEAMGDDGNEMNWREKWKHEGKEWLKVAK
jgi:hypothetical protein